MIRAADQPVRPGSHARPADPAQPGGVGSPGPAGGDERHARNAPDDVYLYRDTSDAAATASGQGPDEGDTSYWYDLSGADGAPADSAAVLAETRGPFEPLVSSNGPSTAGPAPASNPAVTPVPPNARAGPGPEDPTPGRTGKLEPIREFYRPAETVGEPNVDEHFDQLLAQQRELISDYFKEPPVTGQAEAEHDGAVTPEHPGVPAEPPRAW